MLQLGPVLERLQDELLDKLITRTFGILYRLGMIPPIPDELLESGEQVRPEYISILAQAQKLVLTVGVERWVGFGMQLAEAKPEALDKINAEKVMDEYGELLGINPELINSEDVVQQLRDQRERQAMMSRDVAGAARDATQAAKNVDEIQDPQRLAQMLSAMGGAGGPAPGVASA